jgi:hypothetical protein
LSSTDTIESTTGHLGVEAVLTGLYDVATFVVCLFVAGVVRAPPVPPSAWFGFPIVLRTLVSLSAPETVITKTVLVPAEYKGPSYCGSVSVIVAPLIKQKENNFDLSVGVSMNEMWNIEMWVCGVSVYDL